MIVFPMPLILVTGATGFLGSHLAEVLVQQGFTVRCTLRPSSSMKWLEHLELEKVNVDFNDEASLQKACEGVDVVVHNAGITRAKTDEKFFEVNTHATERLAKAAIKAKVSRFIFVSSLEARGPDGFSTAISSYGKSKLEAERRLSNLQNDIEMILLRPAGVYGPRDTDLLTLFQVANYGFLTVPATNSKLQPVHARDVAEAVLASIQGKVQLGPFDIAHAATHTWQDMADALETAMNKKLRVIRIPKEVFLGAGYASEAVSKVFNQLPKLDRRRAKSLAYYTYTCNTQSFKEASAWEARISLQDGLRETAQWYKQQSWL
ncbi:MAG: NAD-dependent epimerase/dehydratase family protein [Trueperaceae bacterium]